jgi:hypothetical protein
LKIKFILTNILANISVLTGKFHHLTHISPTLPNISVLLEDISTHIFTHLSTKTLGEIAKTSVFLLENISTHIFAHL